MPEGPEIHLACRFVNHVCSNRIFSGKVVKSVVSKCDDVSFDCESYTVSASARGKEMQLALHPNSSLLVNKEKKYKTSSGNMTKILFRFGMSGSFHFSSINELHKHAHLKFFTKETPPMVLSFVDTRRFGRWEVNSDWSKDRSPDPMFEYQVFRSNIVMNISNKVFERPICEVLLDQKFFNGIGNYLRAEILYRSGIAPFTKARNVLEGLPEIPVDNKIMDKCDILHLCHVVPLEVINLKGTTGFNPDGRAADYQTFLNWLQCYQKPGMNNIVDHNSRTVWFKGPAGPMAPKDGKSRGMKKSNKRKNTDVSKSKKQEHSVSKKRKSNKAISRKNSKSSQVSLKNTATIVPTRMSKRRLNTKNNKVKAEKSCTNKRKKLGT